MLVKLLQNNIKLVQATPKLKETRRRDLLKASGYALISTGHLRSLSVEMELIRSRQLGKMASSALSECRNISSPV